MILERRIVVEPWALQALFADLKPVMVERLSFGTEGYGCTIDTLRATKVRARVRSENFILTPLNFLMVSEAEATAQIFSRAWSNPRLRKYYLPTLPYKSSDILGELDKWNDDPEACVYVVTVDGLSSCYVKLSYELNSSKNGYLWMTYGSLNPDSSSKGHTKAAVAVIQKLLLDHPSLSVMGIATHVSESNVASILILRDCGFEVDVEMMSSSPTNRSDISLGMVWKTAR